MKQCIQLSGGTPFKGVIHIGAHLGEEGQDYQDNGVEKVVWFEANPELMEELEKRTENLKKLKQGYVGACLSDKKGKAFFNVANNGQSSSLLALGTHAKLYPHIQYTKSIEVETHRMDEFEPLNADIHDYDFINLDVQGAELKVLKGFGELLKLPNFRAIYSEVNSEHVYEGCCLVGELDTYLREFGFKRIATAAPEKAWGDSLFVRQDV